jgi:predicted enzyme related to lactoylglutathione lyase
MLGRMKVMAFVPVKDLERAATFYGSVLGLELASRVPGVVCVFDAGGTALRVTAVEGHVAAAWTVVGWAVPDLEATLRQLGGHGLEPNSYPGMTGDDGTWTAPGGDRIAWLTDPDGNVLSLTQFVSDHAQAREIVPIFPTRDLPEAIERYARLGFTTSSFDVDGTAVYGFLERDGVHVHLAPFDELDPGTTTSAAYLYVDDADALSAEWGSAGVEGLLHPVQDTDYGLREGAYVDPDGNLIRYGSFFR